jgi:hypothetical protein
VTKKEEDLHYQYHSISRLLHAVQVGLQYSPACLGGCHNDKYINSEKNIHIHKVLESLASSLANKKDTVIQLFTKEDQIMEAN